jgi:hypothetical protein
MTEYRIYQTNDEYIVSPDDPTQVIRGELADILRLWARLETFIRDQKPDGIIEATNPLVSATELLDMPEALKVAHSEGYDIKERALRWNLDKGNIAGAIKDGGRWKIPRGHMLEWLRNR